MLEPRQIADLIRERPGKATIQAAIEHEQRLSFHAKTALNSGSLSAYKSKYLDWVKSLLPADKYKTFEKLLQTPLKTVALTSEIFEALSKIFDARDAHIAYTFERDDDLADWVGYKQQAAPQSIWEEAGFEAMKYAPNSLMVVDMPATPSDPPKPYFYFRDVADLYAFASNRYGAIQWVVFREKDTDHLFINEDGYYRLTITHSGKEPVISITDYAPHELGYCPVRWFWSDPVSWRTPDLKASPITERLAELDWLLFFETAKQHLDLYAPYPIYSGFSQNCDYTDENGNYCEGGYLHSPDGVSILSPRGRGLMPCPACSTSPLAGPGSFVEIDPPGPDNDQADLRNPVQILTIDRQSLDYNVEEIQRLKELIFNGTTGASIEVLRNQAINKDQVASFFESRKAALIRLKRNFERAQEWVERTICRLRYGDNFGGVSVNYGTEFYLLSAEALFELYEKARNDGADSITLDDLQNQYLETRYKNNPDELRRTKIRLDIDPLRHVTAEQAKDLKAQGLISPEEYLFKVNFSSLLAKFERENGPITRFGEKQTYTQRIDTIRETLLNYVTAAIAAQNPQT